MDDRRLNLLEACREGLASGSLPPWKVEGFLEDQLGVKPPGNFRLAALARQVWLAEATGERFREIRVPEKPYKSRYRCLRDDLIWELDARDEDLRCSLCGGALTPLPRHSALVANYVGGSEIYYSYAGRIQVRGDVERTFTNLLVYGTGLGPIGVTRGCFLINRLGGAEVMVESLGRAVRCNGYMFRSRGLRARARALIESRAAGLRAAAEARLSEFSGRITELEISAVDSGEDHILYVEFTGAFTNFRGHGDISRAVGFIKSEIEAELVRAGIDFELSVIAQGHDGDLKPSPCNKRGRRVRAQIVIPVADFERLLKLDPRRFLAFFRVDSIGARELGCQFYSGMGGEIVPAVYKATQVNPQSPLVSSFQNIFAEIRKGDIVYAVEMPNVEVGIASTREGLIPPTAREALRIMGIRTAEEFAAALAAQVLAGEFNLALEISRQKLYSP
jgi:hypothetical protein